MGVCMCAHDYKSHSANGISVLPAISFHAWQMTMLSAHNTIFLLPRLQHIVLFRKQTFQPILFVMMRGSGRVHAHLGRHTRHTRGNRAEERKHVTKADTPKGGYQWKQLSLVLCFVILPLLQRFWNYGLWTNCVRIPWDVCKNMRIPRFNLSLTEPGFLEGWTRSWHFSRIVACHGQVMLIHTLFENESSIFFPRPKAPTCK